MASMSPTASGQYHYVSEFAPHGRQRFLSYCSGWLSSIAWQSIVAVDCYIISGIIQAVLAVNDANYTPTRWAGTLFSILTVIVVSAFNVFAASHLSIAEGVFATCRVFAIVPVCVTLWVMVSPKQSVSEVFLRFRDHTGSWPSTAVSVLAGQITCIFMTLGSDAVAHLAEEVENAGLVVPQGMVMSFIVNMPLSFIMLLTYTFNIGSVEEALKAPYPFVYVFANALGSASATTAFAVLILILIAMVTVSAMAATSRQTFAFARDNGFPFSTWISRVSPRFRVPVNAIMVTAGYTSALSLINIGSTEAFEALLSLSSVALMATYVLSISCVTLRRMRKQRLPKPRWSLGRAGLPINCAALFYACWSFFWSFWPMRTDITPSSFNWACVLFPGLMGLAFLLYKFGGRRRYEGPVTKVQMWMNSI